MPLVLIDRNVKPKPAGRPPLPVIKALTIHQPWVAATLYLGKPVENRVWSTTWRGWVGIHAGKHLDEAAATRLRRDFGGTQVDALPTPKGAFVALARLQDCHHGSDRKCRCPRYWAERDAFHFVWRDLTPLRHPIPATGAQRLWLPPAPVLRELRKHLPK